MTDTTGGDAYSPPSLVELALLRSDYEDVPVDALGGKVLRVYALTGSARADLMAEMFDLAGVDPSTSKDPAVVTRVLTFTGRVVGASLGYPREQWDQVPAVIGAGAVEQLWDVASRLSGIDTAAQERATERLPRRRKVASGTG